MKDEIRRPGTIEEVAEPIGSLSEGANQKSERDSLENNQRRPVTFPPKFAVCPCQY